MKLRKFEIWEKCPGLIFQISSTQVLKMPAPGASNSRKKCGLENQAIPKLQIRSNSHSHAFLT